MILISKMLQSFKVVMINYPSMTKNMKMSYFVKYIIERVDIFLAGILASVTTFIPVMRVRILFCPFIHISIISVSLK